MSKSVAKKAEKASDLIQDIKGEVYKEFGGHGSITVAADRLDIHPATLTNAFGATKYLEDLGELLDKRRNQS
jgi:hypothetical protein